MGSFWPDGTGRRAMGSAKTIPRSGGRGIGGMSHQRAGPGLELRAHPSQDRVCALAHQRHQLDAIAAVDGNPAMVGLGIGGAVPVEVVPAGAPGLPGVFTDGDFGVGGLVGTGHRTEVAADRQLPTDVWLGLDVVASLPKRQQVQRAASASREARAVEEDAGAVHHAGLAAGWLAVPYGLRRLRLHPAVGGRLILVLPQLTGELPGGLAYSLLIGVIGEMRAQCAASVVRAIGVDTRTAAAEDAGPV